MCTFSLPAAHPASPLLVPHQQLSVQDAGAGGELAHHLISHAGEQGGRMEEGGGRMGLTRAIGTEAVAHYVLGHAGGVRRSGGGRGSMRGVDWGAASPRWCPPATRSPA